MTNFVTLVREKTDNGDVCRITIDNQKKLNTLNTEILGTLKQYFDDLKEDKDVAVIILTGAGEKSFIGGANINEMATLNSDTARTFITNLHLVCRSIRAVPVPVIARVNGYCLGAGMEIAAICDLVIAEEKAEFAMPEVRVGIPSVIEAAILPRILGVGLARDLVMTARTMYSEEAHRAGFIQRLAKNGDLDKAMDIAIKEILAGGRRAIALQKDLCNAWEDLSLSDSIQAGIDAFSHAFETDEPSRMLRTFVDRKR